MPYTVKQTCRRCGRDSKFESTDKVRACPLCSEADEQRIAGFRAAASAAMAEARRALKAATLSTEDLECIREMQLLPEQFKRAAVEGYYGATDGTAPVRPGSSVQ